jgi:hypothetical protein
MLPKHPLLQKCLKALESVPTFQAEVGVMPYVAGDFLADGQLFLTNAQARSEYIYEIKSDVTRDTIDLIIPYFVNLQQRLPGETRSLLITHQLSDYVVDRLVEKEIEFIDATGNIFLNSPGNYVLVRRPLRRPGSIIATDITSSTVQLMYLILRDPAVLAQEKAEHKLAALSGMAIGTIKTHLNRLEKLGYLQFRPKQKRYRLIDYIKLFERWEIGYAEILRPELLLGSFDYQRRENLLSDIQSRIDELTNTGKCLIGGEWAVGQAVGDFRSPYITLHLPQTLKKISEEAQLLELRIKLKLQPTQALQGTVTILKQFNQANIWLEASGFSNMVDPLLIHAETRLSNDARAQIAAQDLLQQYILPRASIFRSQTLEKLLPIFDELLKNADEDNLQDHEQRLIALRQGIYDSPASE